MELTAEIFEFKTGWIKFTIFNFYHAGFFPRVIVPPQGIGVLKLKTGEGFSLKEEFKIMFRSMICWCQTWKVMVEEVQLGNVIWGECGSSRRDNGARNSLIHLWYW